MKRYTESEIKTIQDKPWMTPDVLTWQLNLQTGYQRSVMAVRKKQKAILGFNPVALKEEF